MTEAAHRLLDDMEHLMVRLRRELRRTAKADPPWMQLARLELGEKEIPGPANNPRVLEYIATCEGLPEAMKEDDSGTAWCSCWVNWVFAQLDMKRTGRANARSWSQWGVGLTDFAVGAVVVLSRGSNPALGHVGFYVGEADTGALLLLAGNQGNSVSIASKSKDTVVAVRWPAGEAMP